MKVIELETVDSTNNYGKTHLDEIPDKTVIHSLRQTAGRGRLARSWIDLGTDNLFISFILKPSSEFQNSFPNLTQYLSVVLCRLLEKYNLIPAIKWPNDVLINGKKIAGILAETVSGTSGKIKGIVLGIGVNLNADEQQLKNITDKIATSISFETKKQINMQVFRDELVEMFFKDYDKFLENGFEMIKNEYTKRNCFLEKELTIQVFDRLQSGFAKSVNYRGELVLINNNEEITLNIGDII